MGNGVEAHFDYGGLLLTCDNEAFARLCAFICAEPSVADAIGGRAAFNELRFISVRHPSAAERSPAGLHWPSLIGLVIVGVISGTATIVGLITIARWLIGLIA
jgi:hypothetical protein